MPIIAIPETVTLRPATVADAGGIARAHIDSWRAAYAGIVPQPVLDEMHHGRRTRKWEDWLAANTPETRCFVAEEAGVILGFANGGPLRGEVRDYSAELYALYLLPAHQRLGLGRALVGAVAGWLRAQGHRNLLVWVLKDNPARHFYAHLGAQPLCGQTITIGSVDLPELAYGWPDIGALIGE